MFRRQSIEQQQARNAERKAANLAALATPSRSLHRAVYEGKTTAAPKSEPKRNRHLLDMARGKPCLLRIKGVCCGDTETTVACHSNLSIHGKAGARKAEDAYSVVGCFTCHQWLDQGKASAHEKEMAFMVAHLDQTLEWLAIVRDPHASQADRNAAQWALDQLNVGGA